tara:strand:+ start:1201 stop:1692 length:492 start_codon:yes stop_codon:yes gene_type:complete
MIVQLTPAEMFLATTVGASRQWQNLDAGRKDKYGFNADPWAMHIESSRSECALAKALNVFWSGNLGDMKAADVGRFQVRLRVLDLEVPEVRTSLILHPQDKDEDTFFLIWGRRGKYKIMGFLKAVEGKIDKYWSDPAGGRPAFFVPPDVMHPFEEWDNRQKRS